MSDFFLVHSTSDSFSCFIRAILPKQAHFILAVETLVVLFDCACLLCIHKYYHAVIGIPRIVTIEGAAISSSRKNSNYHKNKRKAGQKYQPQQEPKQRQTLPLLGGKKERLIERSRPLMLRVPTKLLESLKDEASKDDASVNSFIITVLKKYTSWGRFQERLGFMPLHKSMVKIMLSKMTPDEIEEMGQMQKDQTIRDFLLFESGYNLESFIQWIGLRCKVLGFELLVKQETNPDSIFIMIHHDMGENWSLYYKGMFTAVLQELLPSSGSSHDKIILSTNTASFGMHLIGVKIDVQEMRNE